MEAVFLKENQDNVPRGTYFNQNNSFNPPIKKDVPRGTSPIILQTTNLIPGNTTANTHLPSSSSVPPPVWSYLYNHTNAKLHEK